MHRLTFLSLLAASVTQAQIPNPDFESWTYTSGRPEPVGWVTYNNFTNNVFHVVPAAPGFESDTALNSRTIYTGISVFPGYAEATFTHTSRPAGLAWYSKHHRMAGDTVRITCVLDPGATPVGALTWDPANNTDSNGFVFHYSPIAYVNANTPSTAKITLEGGDDGVSQTGTWLIVDEIHFCDAPPPTGTAWLNGPTTANEGDTLIFVVTGVPQATLFNWTVPSDATIISGPGTDSIAVVWGSASGTVSVRSSNDCGPGPEATITIQMVTVTEPSRPIALSIYPNPAIDHVVIVSVPGTHISVTDLWGRTLADKTIINGRAVISVEGFPSGLYVISDGSAQRMLSVRH